MRHRPFETGGAGIGEIIGGDGQVTRGGANASHIDADHAYESIKKDFELYSKILNPHGIISIHDTDKTFEKEYIVSDDIKKEEYQEYGQEPLKCPDCGQTQFNKIYNYTTMMNKIEGAMEHRRNQKVGSKTHKINPCITYSMDRNYEAVGLNKEVYRAQAVEIGLHRKRHKTIRIRGDFRYVED